jgi:microcin C transport system permease protein
LIGRSFWILIGVLSLFSWIGLSQYMRAEFIRLRNFQFVKAAKAMGMSHRHIFFKEILPNGLTPLITIAPFAIIGGIGSLTALDYLGFGLQPPTPSWGELISQGLQNIYAWWVSGFTILALFITLLLTTFVGEGVRDAFDPKGGDQ